MIGELTERYYRQILPKEIGFVVRRRIFAAKVLVVGAGGLGSPAALCLAAVGVGRLGIVDFDTVDRTYLQHQILHMTGDIGRPKVQRAMERVTATNPDVEVVAIHSVVHADNVRELIRPLDFIIDGTDNAAAKYLKYIVGTGEFLAGRLLVYAINALKSRFHEVRFPPPDGCCPVCGKNPSVTHPSILKPARDVSFPIRHAPDIRQR